MSEVSSAPVSEAPATESSAQSTEAEAPKHQDEKSEVSALGKTSVQSDAPAESKKDEDKDASAPKDSKSEETARKEAESEAEKEFKKEIRKLKLKVNGKERELTEEEVIRRAQLAEAADEKFKEAAEKNRMAEQFLQALKSNPLEVLAHPDLGIDVKELATQVLGEEYRRQTMDPAELEREEMRQQLEAYKQREQEELQRREQEELTTRQEQLRQQYQAEYDKSITSALQESGLPKNPYTVKKIAQIMRDALEYGYDMDAHTAADMVKEQHLNDLSEMFGTLEGEQLISMLGPELAKKIRKYDLAQVKSKLAASQPEAVADKAEKQTRISKPSSSQKEYLRPDEWKEKLRKKAGLA